MKVEDAHGSLSVYFLTFFKFKGVNIINVRVVVDQMLCKLKI